MIMEFPEAYETMVSLDGSRFPWVISKRAAQRSNLIYIVYALAHAPSSGARVPIKYRLCLLETDKAVVGARMRW
jgi:hypothetical protein